MQHAQLGMLTWCASGSSGSCGRTLAWAHARSGDPALLAGYKGKSEMLDDALASFAMAYAALTKHDYAQLKAAIGTKAALASK